MTLDAINGSVTVVIDLDTGARVPHFAEPDLTSLHAFIEQHSFGLLISQVDGLPFATHLPFLLDRDAGPQGTRSLM
jgi:predicted FMN-binding regulatory protein PaiB